MPLQQAPLTVARCFVRNWGIFDVPGAHQAGSIMAHSEPDLSRITTEQRNPVTTDIDTLSTAEMLRVINKEDAKVASAVADQIQQIAAAVDGIVDRLSAGGRLLYIGAGTSGRLGVLDASECPPTFNTPPELVVGLIAGGDYALRNAVEHVEDSPEAGAKALQEVDLNERDTVVGIAASGRTPFVLGAIEYARAKGALTIGVCNSADAPLSDTVDIPIAVISGPEVITGSTRLKSGTAQKLVLNMLSTATMIRLGKTYGNLMVDVQPTNEKLRVRAVRIVAEATGLEIDSAKAALEAADGEVKTAIVSALTGMEPPLARERIAEANGRIRTVINGDQA